MNIIKNNSKMLLFVSSIFIIVLPLIISISISLGDWLSWFDGTSTTWIGFWGSYLGGVIGTAGVIYVAYIQSKQQRELNEKMMKEQREISSKQIAEEADRLRKIEKYNRERLRIETQINMLKDYSRKVKQTYEEMLHIRIQVVKLVGTKRIVDTYGKSPISNEEIEQEFKKILFSFEKYNTGYVKNEFQDILYTNSILYHKDIELEFPEYNAPDKVDSLLDYINSPLKKFEVETFMEKFGDLNGNGRIKNHSVDKTINWLSDELASTYKSISGLIKKLDDDISD